MTGTASGCVSARDHAEWSWWSRTAWDYYNPAFTKSEVEDLVAYLNRDFYRFP